MEMTRERISFTFDPRDMLLSLQMGFSFVRAAVACAILERTSGLEPSSECSKVLETCYSTQYLPFYLYLSLDAIRTVIYINIIGSERKHYSLFGSSPKMCLVLLLYVVYCHNYENNRPLGFCQGKLTTDDDTVQRG